jgi:uncharacterized membrane protein YdcZ (DUF606 family)
MDLALIAGDRIGARTIAGVGLLALALLILAADAYHGGHVLRETMVWTALTGAIVALYVLCDARGVRASGSALAYGATVAIRLMHLFLAEQRAASK